MKNHHRRTTGAALALVLAVLGLAVACSSNNSTTTAGPPATGGATTAPSGRTEKTERPDTTETVRRATTTRRAGTTTTDEDASDTGENDDDTTTTSRRSSSTTSGGGDGGSFTTITVKPTSGNEDLCNTMATEFNNLGSVVASKPTEAGLIEAVADMYDKLAQLAPPEIQPDFEAVVKVIKGAKSFQEIATAANDPGFVQASQRLDNWITTNCGVNPQLPTNVAGG